MQVTAIRPRPVFPKSPLIREIVPDRYTPSFREDIGLVPMRMENEAQAARELKQKLTEWPAVKAFVGFGPDANGNTTALIAGRPEDVQAVSLQGMHEVMARLASSPSLKYAAEVHKVGYEPAREIAPEVVRVRLPGRYDAASLEKTLHEGFGPNPASLGVTLPPGRVALLVGGPSGAGKTTLAERIQDMLPERKVVTLQCDMYYRNWEDPAYPQTPAGTKFWDNPEAMHMDELSRDIAELLSTGQTRVPVFDFSTGQRLAEEKTVELGPDDVLVLDSIFATNPKIVGALDAAGAPHATLFLDTKNGEDRLVRRIVRDYEHRGASAQFTFDCWKETTLPGEIQFVRPSLLSLDPAHDGFYRSEIPQDKGLSVDQIARRVRELGEERPASYEAFG